MTAGALAPRRGMSALARREARWGYLFLSPWIAGFLLLTLAPMVATLVFTFTNINLAQGQEEPLRFVGLHNYERLIKDAQAWESLGITLRFGLIALPVSVIVPFVLALLLNSRYLRGRGAFQVLFFLPYVVPFVASVLIWQGMLNPAAGWIDEGLRAIGIADPPDWLQSVTWIYPALILVGIWGIGAGVIVNLAGLRAIPTEYYDAARIDGAGPVAQLRHVTLPMMSPVIFYTVVLGIVEILQYFLVPLVLLNGTGNPGGTTFFLNLYIYKTFFTFQDMAYGATLAWMLFIVTLAITVVLFASARRWVYYAGER
jgi:multiple sugar transport system permease protein